MHHLPPRMPIREKIERKSVEAYISNVPLYDYPDFFFMELGRWKFSIDISRKFFGEKEKRNLNEREFRSVLNFAISREVSFQFPNTKSEIG